jgi:23S rRNA (uracil1939-C5)-methyltransferase
MHAPSCGGCAWQQMRYEAQLNEKQKCVERLFDPFAVRPIIPAVKEWHYRNKMEFSFSQNKAGEKFLGLVLAGTRGHVFNLKECHLVSPWMAKCLSDVRKWWEESGLLAYRLNDTGTLRTLTMREGENNLLMLTVSGNPAFATPKAALDRFVKAVDPSLSLFLRIQQIHKGRPTEFFEMHLAGKDHIMQSLTLPTGVLRFKISPTSFFQPNTCQAEVLYATALSLIDSPKNHVLDLYAGTATLGMAMATFAKKVTSIEINPHACFDAEVNKQLNGLDHLEILCGDVGKLLPTLDSKPDLVVVDPPRPGLGKEAIAAILGLNPPEILYISCNPHTQAPEVQAFIQAGYALIALQPVDQFPHTPHIENIAYLKR